MARLPQPGGDDGTWGQVLNDYLSQTLDSNGNIKPGAVQAGALAPNAVTSTSLAVASGSDGQVLIKDSAVTSGFKWGTVSVSASAATSSSLGTVQLAGDLSGTATAPTVPGLATKEPMISAGLNSQYYRGDKSWQSLDKAAVGLGNVDNTTDLNKPISTATQTALNGKASSSHTHAISDVTGLQTALDSKANAADVGAKVLLIDNAAALPAGTPAGVIVVVKA